MSFNDVTNSKFVSNLSSVCVLQVDLYRAVVRDVLVNFYVVSTWVCLRTIAH